MTDQHAPIAPAPVSPTPFPMAQQPEKKSSLPKNIFGYLIFLLIGLVVGGSISYLFLSPQKTTTQTQTPQAVTSLTPTVAPTAPQSPKAKEGELCGGIAAIQCQDGLACYFDPTKNVPDVSGKCVKVSQTPNNICRFDAKQCSDGSYVSRQGSSCQFSKCPGE